MTERKQLSRSDWLGIALFAVGSLGAVVMLLSMSATTPIESKGTLGPYAALWKNSIGIFPSLFLNAAIAFLGARLFLGSGLATLVRNLLGCAGLALAVAVVCGAWKDDAGGWVGLHTGAVLSQHLHVVVGTLVGLISFAAVAWFAWFRGSEFARAEEVVQQPVTPVLNKPAMKIAPRPAVHKTTAANEGVSAAESAALFPDEVDEPVVVKKLSPDEVARASLAPFSASEIPPSPYPEDVRQKGQIPAGARPLETPHASAETAQGAVSAPSVYRWTAPQHERADDAARAHLAETPAAPEPDAAEATEREEATDLSAARLPASPSWEQPAPFQPEAGDEEPVDAYGTPLTLVEKLRKARREAGLGEPEKAPVVEAAAEIAVPRELDADLTSPAVLEETVEVVSLEETTLEVAAFEPLEVEAVAETHEDADEADADEEEETEDELEETEPDYADLHGLAEDEEEDEDLEEDELDEDDLLDDVEAEADEDLEEAEEPEAEPEPVPAPTRAPRVAAEHQQGLFDEPAAKPSPKKVELAEREVVLQPVAAAAVERKTTDPRIEADGRSKLLTEIGCLFIDRGRVAVSMLQRQYEMDFDEACRVLDDLQERGLIGPYLGGQRRDILLNREQWLERMSKAGVMN